MPLWLSVSERHLESVLVGEVELSSVVTQETPEVSCNHRLIDFVLAEHIVFCPSSFEVLVHPIIEPILGDLKGSLDESAGRTDSIEFSEYDTTWIGISLFIFSAIVFNKLLHEVVVVGASVVIKDLIDLFVALAES